MQQKEDQQQKNYEEKIRGERLRLEMLEQQKVAKLKEIVQRNKAKENYEMELSQKKHIAGSAYSIRKNHEEMKKNEFRDRIQ